MHMLNTILACVTSKGQASIKITKQPQNGFVRQPSKVMQRHNTNSVCCIKKAMVFLKISSEHMVGLVSRRHKHTKVHLNKEMKFEYK